MNSFGNVWVHGAIVVHMLSQKRSVQFRKTFNTYLRTSEVYKIAFGFLPNSKTEYRVDCHISHYYFHSSRKVQILFEYDQTRSILSTKGWLRRVLQMVFHTAQILNGSSGRSWSQEILVTEVKMKDQEQARKNPSKLKSFFRMNLLSVSGLQTAEYNFPRPLYIAFCETSSLCFPTTLKIFNH